MTTPCRLRAPGMAAWFDEAEQVFGHLRDPHHRVDTLPSTVQVQVTVGDRLLAATDQPMLLSETGLPNRLYLPPEDVQSDAPTPTATTSVCSYQETAYYAGADGTSEPRCISATMLGYSATSGR